MEFARNMQNILLKNLFPTPIFVIWFFCLLALDSIDIFTTYGAIAPDITETNSRLHWAINSFGPEVGVFVVGSVIKLFWALVFLMAFSWIFRKVALTISEKFWRSISCGLLYLGMLMLCLIRIPAILGNLNPYLYS